ncbi:RDD domain-containing protein [Gammaproteobacteria bacterium]
MTDATAPSPRPTLVRRLAAMVYDFFLLFSLLFIAGFLSLPFTGGERVPPGNQLFRLYLLVVSFLFYGWFWTHGGQTLGMRAWRLRVQRPNGSPVGWKQAALRFLAALVSWACLGLGFLWILVDKDRRAWPDLWSETEMILLKKTEKNNAKFPTPAAAENEVLDSKRE